MKKKFTNHASVELGGSSVGNCDAIPRPTLSSEDKAKMSFRCPIQGYIAMLEKISGQRYMCKKSGCGYNGELG